MKPLVVVSLAILLSHSTVVSAQTTRKHVVHLASEALEGREVGTEGHDLARDYIVKSLQTAGVEPAGIDGSWFIPVTVVRRARPSVDTAFRVGDALLARGVGYQVADFSDEVSFDETPVFVGYGLTTRGWDDYAAVDVRDRVVLAFTGAPTKVSKKMRPEDRYLLTEASKAAVALAAGAKAIVFVNDPRGHGDKTDQHPDSLTPLRPAFPLRGIGAAWITAKRARELFGPAGFDVDAYQASLADSPASVEVPVPFSGHLLVEREIVEAHNVVGKVVGTEDAPPVILGAHYDHLGKDGPGSRWNGPDAVHPGADDNASGVGVMLSVGRAMAGGKKPRRTVYFLATTGEELGLRGARQASHVLRTDPPGVYVNLDMVGRLRDGKLHAYGVGESKAVGEAVSAIDRDSKLTIVEHPLRDSDSDHVPFAERGWAAVSLSTGRHADYHMPSDTVKGIDWRGLKRVERFVLALVQRLADAE